MQIKNNGIASTAKQRRSVIALQSGSSTTRRNDFSLSGGCIYKGTFLARSVSDGRKHYLALLAAGMTVS